jgi:hypothetical protein
MFGKEQSNINRLSAIENMKSAIKYLGGEL